MTSIEFHPSESGILAGGSFTGQLTIWDLNFERQSEDPTICFSSLTEESHFESITKVLVFDSVISYKIVWLTGASRKQSKILTTSSDGKVIVWELIQKLDLNWTLEILQGFLFTFAIYKRFHLQYRNLRGALGPVVIGGTSLSLNYFDTSTFVVGTEGGQIHKCSLPRFTSGSFTSFLHSKIY